MYQRFHVRLNEHRGFRRLFRFLYRLRPLHLFPLSRPIHHHLLASKGQQPPEKALHRRHTGLDLARVFWSGDLQDPLAV